MLLLIGIPDNPIDYKERVAYFGVNTLPMKKPQPFYRLVWNTLKEPTLIILEIVAVVSLAFALWNVFRPNR